MKGKENGLHRKSALPSPEVSSRVAVLASLEPPPTPGRHDVENNIYDQSPPLLKTSFASWGGACSPKHPCCRYLSHSMQATCNPRIHSEILAWCDVRWPPLPVSTGKSRQVAVHFFFQWGTLTRISMKGTSLRAAMVNNFTRGNPTPIPLTNAVYR